MLEIVAFFQQFVISLELGEAKICSKLDKKVRERYSTQAGGALFEGKHNFW